MPLQSFSGTHAQLIQQSIEWLTETRATDSSIAEQRSEFEPTWRAAREYEAQAIPRSQMTDAMKRLIDSTSEEWKEEALWLAGEAHLRMMYFDEPRHLAWAPYGYPISETMPLPKPEYFTRLLEQFPNSPLLGFAQWRLAECDFRPTIYHGSKQLGQLDDESRDRLLEQFGKVTAEPGSLPWAWTQSRLGRIRFQAGDCDKAVERYRSITETMPPGVEKINALLNLAKCLSCTNQSEAARVAIEAVKSLPNIEQRDKSFGHYESLLGYGESQELASRLK